MKLNSFGDVEKFLLSRRPDINTVNWFFSLEDMKEFMTLLGNPQNQPKTIHVAGTSGKTSTCYYLSKFIQSAGRDVGLSVSPNVEKISERVQINGASLSDEEFFDLFDEFISLPKVKSVDITYFGLMVAFAFWVFGKKKTEYTVIEVGMGGRLDATNVISNQNKISVITDIGLDHTKFLGDTLDKIATEKAGIILPNSEVFMALQEETVMNTIKNICQQRKAKLHVLEAEQIEEAPKVLPPFQRRNWSLAKMIYEFLNQRDGLVRLSSEQQQQIADIKVPARMEVTSYNGKTVILDGSHNGQKIRALVQAIKEKYPEQKFTLVISMVDGKDSTLSESLKALSKVSDKIIITEFTIAQDIKRDPIPMHKIAQRAQTEGFSQIIQLKDPIKALNMAIEDDNQYVLVTGSFFLLNHIRPLVVGN